MTEKNYQGPERRKFIRLEYITPIACKVCKPETISKILQGYTVDISQAGVLCRLAETVNPEDIVWLSFDKATLSICQELERNCFIYQNGIIGKVVRVEKRDDGTYKVGVQFLIREEPNISHIYPKIYFLKDKLAEGIIEEVNDEEQENNNYEAEDEDNGENKDEDEEL